MSTMTYYALVKFRDGRIFRNIIEVHSINNEDRKGEISSSKLKRDNLEKVIPPGTCSSRKVHYYCLVSG